MTTFKNQQIEQVYDLMSLFSAYYESDRDEWNDVLDHTSRDDGGFRFCVKDQAVIDIFSHVNFRPIMMWGSEADTDSLGIEATDFHFTSDQVLFQDILSVYDRLDYGEVIVHKHWLPCCGHKHHALVAVQQLIPLSYRDEGEISACYFYLRMESFEFGEEYFAGVAFNHIHGQEVIDLVQDNWARRILHNRAQPTYLGNTQTHANASGDERT